MIGNKVIGELRQRAAIRTRARALGEEILAGRYAGWRHHPLQERTVLYESFFGNGMLDNPEAIFRHLLEQPDMADLTHIWALNDLEAHPTVVTEFAGNTRVQFVSTSSPEYFEALATAKYLVNNATWQQRFAKRDGQVYVNTWHGVPLKHMGYDMPGGGIESRNVLRNFLSADYLVSGNALMTEVMYRSAYRLQGIFRGAVIEEGQPRIDRQVQTIKDPAAATALLAAHGIEIGGRKVVIFAPTWRGNAFAEPQVNAAELVRTVRQLQKRLGEDYLILLKTHQLVHDAVRQRLGETSFLVSNDIPANVVLGVSDLLVTDYSSIFFDYLGTGRPVVHYVPDLEDYEGHRGLYLRPDELFGPFVRSVPELVDQVRESLAAGGQSERSLEGAARYCAKDDGNATARLVDIVFRGADESSYTVHRDFGTDKERICIYLGSMASNGIMTSALNLLHNLDHDRYDVTAYWAYSKGRDRTRNANLVDSRVRVIPRTTLMNAGPATFRRVQRQLLIKGLPATLSQRHKTFWRGEYQRMFGDAEFDHLIDFSGYGCHAPFLFTAAHGSPRTSIWLHNDMAADQQRETAGTKHLEARLGAVFSTYKYFDHLVSVSPELMRLNQKNLAAHAAPDKFRFALNTINGERVLQMAGLLRADSEDGEEVSSAPAHLEQFDTTNVAAAVSALMKYFPVSDIVREARSRKRINTLDVRGKVTTFVTVGRLSQEKNHRRLIDAFARVHSKHPDIRLVILGGGPLELDLAAQISNLGMEPFISLAGQVDNPFAILAQSNCFVLSSDYEGQPMVILEARTLGLPVVTTSFSSVGDSVPPEAGIVVPKTVEGVVDGLQKFVAGKVPAGTFDFHAYNDEAVAQFRTAIGSDS